MDYIVENFPTIATVLLTAAVGAYFLWRNNFKTRRANACAAFRSAVLTELGSIYPTPAPWPENIDAFLRARFPALQTAVENFRPFVPWWSRWGFNRAWSIYLHGSERNSGSHYYQYMGYSSPDKVIPDSKVVFHENVSRLLFYANET